MSSTEQPTTDADTHKGGHLLYPQPGDGKLIPLVVQSFQRPSLLPENVPWTRLGEPLSKAGTMEAIWYWVLSPILVKGSEKVDYSLKPCFLLFLRLLAAGPLCALMIPNALASIVARIGNIKSKSPEQIDTQCQYPKLPTPLPHSSSSSSSSSLEAREALPLSSDPSSTNIQLGGQLASPRPDQTSVSNVSSPSSRFQSRGLSLGPRYLCFITDPETRQYSTMKVSDYNQQHGDQADTEFVFVSYTRLQFRVFTDAEISAWTKYGSEEIREANRTLAHRDRETLIQWGIDAALAAGKRAFWLDFECVRDSDGVAKANVSSKSEDVYRICDIVRAAHSMIIAIGPPADEKEANILNGDENVPSGTAEHANKWLRQWGSRLWTLPELLLCPNEYRIKLCVAGDVNEPKSLAKRNFAERAWDDAESVKELVNHYEGSAILPPTQLISIALECFARRKTDQFSQGDIAYAVMGLFPDSQRPVVNQNDSGFRAFARLALAVEGSSLLTRLLCLAPAQPGAQWSDARDYWGVKLKDFRPCCDAVDVAGSNAVEVQNIPAAPICWDKIQKATFQGRLPIFPEIIFVILLFFPLFTWYRIAHLLIFAFGGDPIQGYVSRFLFLVFMVQVIFTPLTLPALFLYEWKIRRTDLRSARLVGMEGVVDCATAERHIYGYHCGRLREISSTTTTSGSETAIYEPGAPRKFTFTLIDTCAQTLRVINCAAPPIAMMLCGEDAAGHRAILCSYNHETGVYHREETLRVEECVRQQMKSARSVNLSLEPFPLKLTKAPHDEDVINSSLDGQAPTTSREWKPELVFFIIQCIATPQYRIIQLSEFTHRNSFVLLFFGFVLAQPIAFFLLHKRLFSRAVAPMVYLQAAFQSLSIAKTMKYETIFIIVFQGIAIGLFLPYMVLHTISWHSIRETAFRLLFLTSSAMMYRDKARQHATGALYISIFALFSTSLLDLPEVKPWTNSFEGVSLTRRSARHKFSAEEREHAPRWARQDLPQSATIISLLFFIMATVSNSIISGALINTYHLFFYDPNVGLKSFYCLLTFFITILLWIYPHFIHTVTLGCSTISILGLYGCSMLGSNTFVWPAMASAQLLILPLSWIWIVHRTTSWKGFITYVTLSLAGWGGWRLANNLIGELGKQQVFIFAALQPCLFGCVWVLEVIRERRVAQAAQRRLVRSEYQDNVAEAGLEMNEKVVQSDASQGFEEMKAKKWPLICWFGLLLIERALSALNTSMH